MLLTREGTVKNLLTVHAKDFIELQKSQKFFHF